MNDPAAFSYFLYYLTGYVNHDGQKTWMGILNEIQRTIASNTALGYFKSWVPHAYFAQPALSKLRQNALQPDVFVLLFWVGLIRQFLY